MHPNTRQRYPAILAVSALALALMLPAAGCGGSSSKKGGQLTGVNWQLTDYLDGTLRKVPSEFVVSAQFAGAETGRLSGTAVNSYSGAYESDKDGALKIGPIAATKMMGPEPLMQVETAYFDALGTVASYASDAETLRLYDDGGKEILRYKKGPEGVVGAWNVTGYNNGKQAVVSVLATAPIDVSFSTDDKVSGNGGVNTYGGSYTLDGTKIAIGELASTMMAGDEAAMAQEAAYLAALRTAAAWNVSGNNLELRTADGALAVSATRK